MISAMLQYIQRSPDCFHAVEELRQRLLREGYTELRPGRWQLCLLNTSDAADE